MSGAYWTIIVRSSPSLPVYFYVSLPLSTLSYSYISCSSFLYHVCCIICPLLPISQYPFSSPCLLYSYLLLSLLPLIILCILLLPFTSPFLSFSFSLWYLFHTSLIPTTLPVSTCLCHYAISLCHCCVFLCLCIPLNLTSQPLHPPCPIFSLQSTGVAGPPL